LIQEVFEVLDPELSPEECQSWTDRIRNTSTKEYVDGLRHQQGCGGANEELQQLINDSLSPLAAAATAAVALS